MDERRVAFTRMQSKDNGGLIEIGGIVFRSIEDTRAWVDINLPASIKFSCFVDVYSFLERFFPQSSGSLKAFESQSKLCVTGDEATTLMSFLKELPKVFASNVMTISSSVKCTNKIFSPISTNC